MNVLTIVLGQLPRRESLVSILLVTFVDTGLAAELGSGEVEREKDKQIHCASPQAGGRDNTNKLPSANNYLYPS